MNKLWFILILNLAPAWLQASGFADLTAIEGDKVLAKATAIHSQKMASELEDLKPKLTIAPECKIRLKDGEDGIRKKIYKALDQGFSCMAKVGSEANYQRLKRAQILFADVNQTFAIRCGSSSLSARALSSVPPSELANVKTVVLPMSQGANTNFALGKIAFSNFFPLWDEAPEANDSATACQVCCFPPAASASEMSKVREGQTIACNLCAGKLTPKNVFPYQEAFFSMLDKAGSTSSFAFISDSLLRKAPTSPRLRFRLAKAAMADSAELAPVGLAMVEYLAESYPRTTVDRFNVLIGEIRGYRAKEVSPQTLTVLGKQARWLASAYFKNLDGDWRGSLSSLRQIHWPAVENFSDPAVRTISTRIRNRMLLLAYEVLSEASAAGLMDVKVLMKEGRSSEAEELAFAHLQVAGELMKRYRPLAETAAQASNTGRPIRKVKPDPRS